MSAMWLHRSPVAPRAPRQASSEVQGCSTPQAEGCSTPLGLGGWLRQVVRGAWLAVQRGCAALLRAVTPALACGFDVRRWITWVSGEAYVPGPAAPRRHIGDLSLRFHNIQGMSDPRFRDFYLAQARRSCDVLLLAQTGCHGEAMQREYARAWRGGSAVLWASGPPRRPDQRGHSGRGMAALFSSTVDTTSLKLVAADPGGRYMAFSLVVAGCPHVFVVAHVAGSPGAVGDAVSMSDAQQVAFFQHLQFSVPLLPNHRYLFFMDANNVDDDDMDYWHCHGLPNSSPRPLGVAAMHSMLRHFGADRDAFRCLHPHSREYTRSQPPHAHVPISKRRLDRCYVAPSSLGRLAPHIVEVRHLRPGAWELEALRRAGSSSTWSDHAAVHVVLRVSAVPRPAPQWRMPLHVLEPHYVHSLLWPVRDVWLARADLGPQERLAGMMAALRTRVEGVVGAETHAHRVKKSKLHSTLRGCDTWLEAAASKGTTSGPQWDACVSQRTAAIDALVSIQQAEQARWYKDRGYEETAREDTCWKGFFEEVKAGRVNSHVERLSTPTGVAKTPAAIFAEVGRHFGAPGSIFNLERLGRMAPAERARVTASRSKLFAALRADGKVVPPDMRGLLAIDNVLTPWNVQRAIEGLATGASPGLDGWPAELYRRLCPRERDEDNNEVPARMCLAS